MRTLHLLIVLALTMCLAPIAPASVRFPPRPPDGEYVLDQAGMMDGRDIAAIHTLAAALEKDICQRLMDTLIIPEFKAGRFSAGIRAGAEVLDTMARGEEIPSRSLTQRIGTWLAQLWQTVSHGAAPPSRPGRIGARSA